MPEETTIHWKCNSCGQTEAVINGVCPKCGPTQTTPISEEAKQEAGFYEAEAERAEQAAANETPAEGDPANAFQQGEANASQPE